MQVFVVGSFVVACSVKVARLPRAGESLVASHFVAEPGGKGFNLAVAMRRLGAAVSGAFAVGDDPFAEIAAAAFRRGGLPPEALLRRPGSTGAGVGFVDEAGENCLAVGLGANGLLAAADLDGPPLGPALDAADLVAATFESPDAPIAAAFARARARGATTLLNPSPYRPIDRKILAATSLLVVNGVEAAELGLDPEAGAEALHAAGPGTVVVTRGAEGAVALRPGRAPLVQPAFAVPAVDTIGAGDAFAAGLAVGLMQGRPLGETLARAAACGALAVRRLGAFDAFPDAAALDRFLDGFPAAGLADGGAAAPPAP